MNTGSLTQKQLQGLDLTVRTVAQKYTFIDGFELDSDFENYDVTLFMGIIIDLEKLKDFLGLEYDDRFLYNVKQGRVRDMARDTSLYSAFGLDLTDEKDFKLIYDLKSKISKFLNNYYEFLPNEYIIYRKDDFAARKVLNAHEFIVTNLPKIS